MRSTLSRFMMISVTFLLIYTADRYLRRPAIRQPGESISFFSFASLVRDDRPLSVTVRRAALYIKKNVIHTDIKETTGATATLWDREWRTEGDDTAACAEICSGRTEITLYIL